MLPVQAPSLRFSGDNPVSLKDYQTKKRTEWSGKLTGGTQIRAAVAAHNQVFVFARDAVSSKDKVPVVVLAGEV